MQLHNLFASLASFLALFHTLICTNLTATDKSSDTLPKPQENTVPLIRSSASPAIEMGTDYPSTHLQHFLSQIEFIDKLHEEATEQLSFLEYLLTLAAADCPDTTGHACKKGTNCIQTQKRMPKSIRRVSSGSSHVAQNGNRSSQSDDQQILAPKHSANQIAPLAISSDEIEMQSMPQLDTNQSDEASSMSVSLADPPSNPYFSILLDTFSQIKGKLSMLVDDIERLTGLESFYYTALEQVISASTLIFEKEMAIQQQKSIVEYTQKQLGLLKSDSVPPVSLFDRHQIALQTIQRLETEIKLLQASIGHSMDSEDLYAKQSFIQREIELKAALHNTFSQLSNSLATVLRNFEGRIQLDAQLIDFIGFNETISKEGSPCCDPSTRISCPGVPWNSNDLDQINSQLALLKELIFDLKFRKKGTSALVFHLKSKAFSSHPDKRAPPRSISKT
jgi:hypothetical protein